MWLNPAKIEGNFWSQEYAFRGLRDVFCEESSYNGILVNKQIRNRRRVRSTKNTVTVLMCLRTPERQLAAVLKN